MNNLYRFVSVLALMVGVYAVSFAQTAPNCTDVNASLDINGDAHLTLDQFVTNIGVGFATLTVTRSFGQVVYGPTLLTFNAVATIPACAFRDEQLKMSVQIDGLGACWSYLTFKQSNGPQIDGRSKDVYCYDPLVKGGHIDDQPPAAAVPCFNDLTAVHTSDWVVAYECTPSPGDPVNDTAKVIYREYEAFDKEGRRGTVFDTITVFNIPPVSVLTDVNTYCAEKDTTYCGEGFGGPYMLIPERCDPGVIPGDFDSDGSDCDTLYFLVYDSTMNMWVENPIFTEYKCGILVHVDKVPFPGSSCEQQVKYNVDIKQSCLGQIRTECLIDPALVASNAIVEIAQGYYRCEFWLVDLDTVPPIAECKFDKVDDHNLAWPSGYVEPNHIDLGGNIPYHCFDNLPLSPSDSTIAPVIIVSTSSHDCAAHTYLPPICVYDAWSGIKQVKASIVHFGSWSLSSNGEECDELDESVFPGDPDYDVKGTCYESHVQIHLPKAERPYQILYEVYDSCHNIDSIYCYIFVKDRTKPVAVVDKGVTVSLSDKKVWVEAETFDEGSWDNCGVNMLLVRRTDWYEACLDLCDSVKTCCWGEHDTLYQSFLQPDKHRDEIEAYYAKTLDWLKNDGTPCANLIYNAWQYDLMKYATLECIDHPYAVDDEYFREIFTKCYEDYLYSTGETTMFDIDPESPVEYCFDRWCAVAPYDAPGCYDHPDSVGVGLFPFGFGNELLDSEMRLIEEYDRIGGGWSDAVPFTCEDACGPVTVEILVMDYWCNWTKAWSKVWVEDKTPAKVAKDVYDGEITCKSYKDNRYAYPGAEHPVSLEYIVDRSKDADSTALAHLDAILGGYCKAWVDPYGNYVDIDGQEIECDIPYYDSICYCTSVVESVRVYEEHHGYVWKDSLITDCYYEQDTVDFQKGVVVVNCDDNVFCEQTVWCDFDHCGQGYIYRKWKIWQGCPASFYTDEGVPDSLKHPVDTIYRSQRVYVGNRCELNKFMFDVPADQTVYTCGVSYDEDGSGNLVGEVGPESTGYATYRFDDDCRLVGIAHSDKVFKIVGGDEACYKILRTWYFADWCGTGGPPVSGYWWNDYELVTDTCVQKILVFDTLAPVCEISGPVENGGSVITGACAYDLSVDVEATDACGLQKYYWELKDITDPKDIGVYDSGHGYLNTDTAEQFSVLVEGLYPGSYKLKVTIEDNCNNERYCEYYVDIVSGKKPSPICITTLTARLNPWDLDNDGDVDTAKAVIWAGEFNSSSEVACHDDSIAYRIEFIDGDADSTYMEDADSLVIGCEDVGQHIVRLWVLSYPSETVDYCDVVLVVQSDNTGCNTGGQGGKEAIVTQDDMHMATQTNGDKKSEAGDLNLNIPADAANQSLGYRLDEAFTLEQNRPNPFQDETVIGFILPASMQATISVHDVTGRVLREVKGDFTKGKNMISFRKDDLGVSGILYYRLQAGEFSATRRMIMLK
ncbi:MAG: T9SS type A sorting domain-containing protein [Saprospiraceae bacterium]|nr:T9SS type A sorting domain-containing protein [Saprospiraceae bacterium]